MTPYYQDPFVTIYHADCREVLPTLGKCDLLLTDPPYGIKRANGMGGRGFDSTGRWQRKPREYAGMWDSETPSKELLDLAIISAKQSIIWGGNYFPLRRGGKWLVWDKEQVMPSYSDAELAWTNMDGDSVKLFRLHCNKARVEMGLHPTQKPLSLMLWCISLAGDVQTILDPFMGSGTTGRAAKDLGKTCVLIEREEAYCEKAAERMQQEVLPLNGTTKQELIAT